ncbi:MAG: PAS domain S-box protein [Chlorobi bacterium]|nr:PAS domain S-box protein [Chlorobiota bacterium]
MSKLFKNFLSESNFGIFKKLLSSFILIATLPVILFGIFGIVKLSSASEKINEQIKNSIDAHTQVTIELQAIMAAKSIEKFLMERERDLLSLAEYQRSAAKYLSFYNKHSSEIWARKTKNDTTGGVRLTIPLYKDIAFVDVNGNEKIRILNGKIVPAASLKNVKFPKNTEYKCEDYFEKTIKLGTKGIYVSHVTGFYITKEDQMKMEADSSLYPGKICYNGIIRYALPVFENGVLIGIVTLGLDHRHLMEFTQHIQPNRKEESVFPSYKSGNYAFMFDDEGWIITHPKFWDIRGVDKNGVLVNRYGEKDAERLLREGKIPFNLDQADFIHPNYPFVSEEIRNGNYGSVTTVNVGGTRKLMAYAPIHYKSGQYKKYGVFGGVTIGAELNRFYQPANSVHENLIATIKVFIKNTIIFFLVISFVVALISWFVSKHFTVPLLEINKSAKKLADGSLEKSIEINRRDEIGTLASSFNYMAIELKRSKKELINSMENLKESKAAVEQYAKNLEYQIKILKTIQKISNLLGATFELDNILKIILQQCVNSIGFDRAILYLIDDTGKYLECKEIFGFEKENGVRARSSKYNLEKFDVIETRVVREGKIFFIEDFTKYEDATELDKKIRAYAKSNSFVFVPLRMKEKIIGIMGADKLRSGGEITEVDISSLQILANQASRVIETTRLYQELVEQRNFVEDILKYMSNGIISVDSNGIITSVNKAAENILGLAKKNVVGETAKEALSRFGDVINEIEETYVREGSFNKYDIELNVAGRKKYFAINVSPIVGNRENRQGAIIVIQDITEKREFDSQVQRMERLASLGRLAAGLAHEIRNPLTGISLFLDDLHDRTSNDEETAAVILQALNEVERLENLVNELLDYASPRKNDFQEVDLNKLLNSILNLLTKQLSKNKIELTTEFCESPKISADKEKLKQAFLNVLLNAVQAMPAGGKLKATTECGKNLDMLPELNKKKFLVVTIEDSGDGIREENLSKIFDPFFTNRADGTGLGLSITHSIIDEHKGKIFIEKSSLGGAKFIIALPV